LRPFKQNNPPPGITGDPLLIDNNKWGRCNSAIDAIERSAGIGSLKEAMHDLLIV
jgi:hypothetical protein